MTIAGAILAGVCLIISSFAQNVLTLIFTVGIGTGFGFGLIYLPAIVSVTTYFEKYRSLATGIAVCGSGLGTFIFSPMTEYLIGEFGWRGATLILAGIVFNCVIFGAMFRPLEPPKKLRRAARKYTEEQIPLKQIVEKEEPQMNEKQLVAASEQRNAKSSSHSDMINNNGKTHDADKRHFDNFLSVAPIPRSVSIGQDMVGDYKVSDPLTNRHEQLNLNSPPFSATAEATLGQVPWEGTRRVVIVNCGRPGVNRCWCRRMTQQICLAFGRTTVAQCTVRTSSTRAH